MKKILLLTLPLMVMCAVSCEKDKGEEWTDDSPIIQFKDPKFQQALLNNGTCSLIDENQIGCYYQYDIDRNGDDQISEKEASVVHRLDISEAGIRNLEEVKYFTALQILYCDNNELTTLDLSNNTALEQLYCSSNQLISLDLSKNTALTSLSCYANQLTSLDLSNNTALTDLGCPDNQLTSLDLSNNRALTTLYCYDNQLTTLDVSNNTALTELDCADNELTTLDVSKNTALTTLWCQNNQLTELDLNTALTNLSCEGNQLASLNVSGCAALIDLSCHNNPLTSLDVSKCKKIVILRCADFVASDIENTLDLSTKCPLESLKIYKYHVIRDDFMSVLETVYGDIIEYVE